MGSEVGAGSPPSYIIGPSSGQIASPLAAASSLTDATRAATSTAFEMSTAIRYWFISCREFSSVTRGYPSIGSRSVRDSVEYRSSFDPTRNARYILFGTSKYGRAPSRLSVLSMTPNVVRDDRGNRDCLSLENAN